MIQPNKKIVIGIVTYNSRHKIADCLNSVNRQNYPRELVQVAVVDNNSNDSTKDYLAEAWPQVTVIANNNNTGFAAANNQIYAFAKGQADYLVLLNDDTIVEPNWLTRLVNAALSDDKIAAVQSKLLLYPEKNLVNSLGNSIQFLGFAFCNHYREPDNHDYTALFDLPYASGAAVLLKLSALEEIGLFDEKLFMYHEDVDLGWRLRLLGYRAVIDPLSVVYHKYNYSKAKYKFYYMDRNRWIVLLKNYRLATIILLAPMLLIMEFGITLYSIKNGWFKEKLKGWAWLIKNLGYVLSERKKIQGLRQTSDRKILNLFVGSITNQEVENKLLSWIANPLMEIYFLLIRLVVFW
ncbi:MAG: glycosyltransferase family 2 protein [Candidatus Buchananbacteria bacterium]